MTIKFEKPPINELVISTHFSSPINGLRSEHIGLFWHSVKDEFPVVSQHPPVGAMDITTGSEVFPMPRYWMIASDDINLIQIQKNAFMFNWRSRENNYPHYENLKSEFDKYYNAFSDFVLSETDTKKLQIEVCELTYINTIEDCEYWSGPSDTSKVIPTFAVPDIGIKPKEFPGYNCMYAYMLEDDLQLRVSVRHGQSAQNPEKPVLIFEIRASGRIGPVTKSSADKWFDKSHQSIIDCFVGMTSHEIQKNYWKRKETSS